MSEQDNNTYSAAWEQLGSISPTTPIPKVEQRGNRISLRDRADLLISRGYFTIVTMGLILVYLVPMSLPPKYHQAGNFTLFSSFLATTFVMVCLSGVAPMFPKLLTPRALNFVSFTKALLALFLMSVYACILQSGITVFLAYKFVSTGIPEQTLAVASLASGFAIFFTVQGSALPLVLIAGILGSLFSRWYQIHRSPWIVEKPTRWVAKLLICLCAVPVIVFPFALTYMLEGFHQFSPSQKQVFEQRLAVAQKIDELSEKRTQFKEYHGIYQPLLKGLVIGKKNYQQPEIFERFVTKSQFEKEEPLDRWMASLMVEVALALKHKDKIVDLDFTSKAVLTNLKRWNALQKDIAPGIVWNSHFQGTLEAVATLLEDETTSRETLSQLQTQLETLRLGPNALIDAAQQAVLLESANAYRSEYRFLNSVSLPDIALTKMLTEKSFDVLENLEIAPDDQSMKSLVSVGNHLGRLHQTYFGSEELEAGVVPVFNSTRTELFLSLPLRVQLYRAAIAVRLNPGTKDNPLKALESLKLDSEDVARFRLDKDRVLHLEIGELKYEVSVPKDKS